MIFFTSNCEQDWTLSINVKGDSEFEAIEPQLFNDAVNGTGMRIIMYRKDRKVDIYWQPGVFVTRNTISIGAGIEHFMETVIEPSRFDITDHGVDLHVIFTDAQGRKNELQIQEKSPVYNPFTLLAPIGKDIENPERLFLAHLFEFDFVKKKGTRFYCMIGGRFLYPAELPLLRNFKQILMIRCSGLPVIGSINPSMTNLTIFEIDTPGTIEIDGMVYHVDESCKIQKVCISQEQKNVELAFAQGFPNLYDIKNGSTLQGSWIFRSTGAVITGGQYSLARSNTIITCSFNVLQNWKPVALPLSCRLLTGIVRSFRTWPTTYIWNGIIDLEKRTVVGNWSRKQRYSSSLE